MPLVVEGKPGTTCQFKLFSAGNVTEVSGGKITGKEGNIQIIETTLPYATEKYVRKELIIN